MSDSRQSNVYFFDPGDPEMQGASEKARANFRFFWRELAWERRRIVPALDVACVKAPFSDGDSGTRRSRNPEVEQMWLGEVDFDGQTVSGVLLNSPNWLKSVKAGDAARFALAEITDWMYAINGEVYGAYTVNLMRSRMEKKERKSHDDAWGMDFGDPAKIRVVPEWKKPGGLALLKNKLFGGRSDAEDQEHPMSENMGSSLRDELRKNPAMLKEKDDRGWTLLHHQSLAGSLAGVKILLDRGADVNAATDNGMTPLKLAKSLGWTKVAALLVDHGAK